MICRQKVQVYISIGYKIYEPNGQAAWLFDFSFGLDMAQRGKLEFEILTSTKEVLAKKIRRVKALENFQDF